MNTEFKQELYIEAFKNLPEKIQDVLNKSNWEKDLFDISRKHRLRVDQTAIVEGALKNLMVGITDVDGFFEDISDLDLEVAVFESLMDDLEIKIMQVLKDKIITATGGGENDADSEHSRDSILAEIEDEELDARPIPNNIVMPGNRTIPGTSMEKSTATPIVMEAPVMPMSDAANRIAIKSASVEMPIAPASATQAGSSFSNPGDRLGLRGDATPTMPLAPRSFSLSQEAVIKEDEPVIAPARVEGIQKDPIAAGLTKSVSMATPAPQAAPKAYAADPYREPIE